MPEAAPSPDPMPADDFAPPWVAGRTWFTPGRCLGLILLLVAVGSACRLAQYFSTRSLWQDEAYVVLNLRAKSAGQLLGPLDARPGDPQAAPPGFLIVEKAALSAWGVSELPLRCFAQLAGVLSVALFARLAWRLLGGRPAAVFAAALFALSGELISHASEVKQYSGDAFFACLLLWLAVPRDGPPFPTVRRLWAVMPAAAVAVWFSYTAVFVAGGIALAAVVGGRPRGRRLVAAALACVSPGASAVALYFVCVRHQQAPEFYTQWAEFLADWSKPARVPVWAAAQTYALANYAADGAGPITLLLAVIGAAGLWRARGAGRPVAALLVAPVLLCLLAGLFRRYPYGGARTCAFLAPAVCLLAGAGFGAASAVGRHVLARRGAWVLAVVAEAVLLFQAGKNLAVPPTRSHIRPVVERLAAHRRPGDLVYVIGGAASDVYRCYVDPVDPLTFLTPPDHNVELRDRPLPPLPPGRRAWLVFAGKAERLNDSIRPMLEKARAVATEREAFAVRGGAAYLFEVKP